MDPILRLRQVVTTLRGPDGCPWDREQTPSSLRPHLIEEAHEAAAAIGSGTPEEAKSELGDLLFVLASMARAYEEGGAFTLDEVAEAATAKMIRRHPHVFGEATADNVSEARAHWAEAKASERAEATSLLDGIPPSLPAALRADRVGAKVASVGFDWPDVEGVRDKVGEELHELDEALHEGDRAAVLEEYGDLLFSLAQLGRHLGLSAEDALQAATAKFERRFRALEAACLADGREVLTCEAATLERYWKRIKELE